MFPLSLACALLPQRSLFTAFNFLLPPETCNLRIPRVSFFTKSGRAHRYLHAFGSRTSFLGITGDSMYVHSRVLLYFAFFSSFPSLFALVNLSGLQVFSLTLILDFSSSAIFFSFRSPTFFVSFDVSYARIDCSFPFSISRL